MGSKSTNPSLLYLGRFFFQVSVLRLGIYFTVHLNFLLLLTTFEHKRLYFLLLTFSKQTRHFSFNTFEGKYRLCLFCIIASSLPNVHITHAARRSDVKDVARWKQTERETRTGRKGDSYLQKSGSLHSIYQPKILLIKLLHSQTALTNPPDSTFEINTL